MADKMRVVIIGAGVAGLIANYVAKQHKHTSPIVLEPGRVGGEWLSGGLRYLHASDEMKSMIIDIGGVFTQYTVMGGIHLRGKVEAYPDVLRGMPTEAAKRIQQDHYRKTRQTEPDPSFSGKSMNDPEATGARLALRCDASDVVERLQRQAFVQRDAVAKVEPAEITATSGAVYPYDYLIWTAPLWAAQRAMFFRLPDALAIRLNVVYIEPHKIVAGGGEKVPGALKDPYSQWDYIYTPYTPDGLIHRIYPFEDGYACEFNGAWPEGDERITVGLTSDLNFLFPNGWAIRRVAKGLNGHLLPLEREPAWPAHIQPLGRFAQWDPRATADVVLERAYAMCSEWGWQRYA